MPRPKNVCRAAAPKRACTVKDTCSHLVQKCKCCCRFRQIPQNKYFFAKIGFAKERAASPQSSKRTAPIFAKPSSSNHAQAERALALATSRAELAEGPARSSGGAGCIAWSGKLDRARSRLYRSQILQVLVNMRLKALAEIYTMHSFAQL